MPELVNGQIILPDGARFENARLAVYLEDVSLLDAPAKIVAQHIEHGVNAGDAPFPFKLVAAMPEGNGDYAVRVHISRAGDDNINKGDLITKQRYSVLQNSTPDRVEVRVEVV